MRLSYKYNFIYFSKPKCASESMRKLLDPFSDCASSDKYPFHHHTPAFMLKKHFISKGMDWDKYFRFTLIRNPWDLIVSLYHYAKPDMNGLFFWEQSRHGYERNPEMPMEFREWVLTKNVGKSWHKYVILNGEEKTNTWTNNFYSFTIGKFAFDLDGNQLIENIYRSEEISEAVEDVSAKLNIKLKSVPHINQSKRGDYRDYYDDETRKAVEKEFESDIEIGKYTF